MTLFPQDSAARQASEQGVETWETLRGACTRMVPHWAVPSVPAGTPVPPSRIHGVTVPAASARLLDGMSEYGD
ncbi:hypothetical protein AB0I84_18045 [Streptomyces spectabilis]|uniref:Uncharacterized protein n=1 Tax=Streptomyces spectabilis TaxID=68270 RepID=A0A5P2X379_STRST|nr:hypothetical protein [Streptomyces spectabilis]MBB5102881.1 hypothetical protein [Streptomyces spectabilis]MCI3902082.1 hypothetical protein [Streptomyces spectabilis]QEV59473.1 hypothetical protein CP982_12630 [Streptomyces spectabilis]GGV16086.1 hypothetical protein GCM10010245_27840 [Streptomyces spectabilis]